MSDDPGAPRQTFLEIVRHVRRDRRISGSLVLWENRPVQNRVHSQKQSAHWAEEVTAQVVPC